MSEIKKIEHIGTTGGIDGDYSYSFSDNQIVEFIDLLNQVEARVSLDLICCFVCPFLAVFRRFFSSLLRG